MGCLSFSGQIVFERKILFVLIITKIQKEMLIKYCIFEGAKMKFCNTRKSKNKSRTRMVIALTL